MSTPVEAGLIRELIERLERQRSDFENARVTCAITGMSGSGKSSLINAIAGEQIARVNVVEQTSEPQEYEHGGVTFIDLPGCGTTNWPEQTYCSRLNLQQYDCFLLVTSNRFYEGDLFLYKQLSGELQKPCFVIRNKFDLAVTDGAHDNNMSAQEVRQQIDSNIREHLSGREPHKIYMTSARWPEQYDLPGLIEDIAESQVGSKRTRFIADVAAWSEEMLAKKREAAESIAGIYSGLAAANTINPIPGADIAVDMGLLWKMTNLIRKMYGLTEEQTAATAKLLSKTDPMTQAVKQRLSRFATKYATQKAITMLLQKGGKRVAVREISKWLPFVGSMVSGYVGYKLTYWFAENLISDSEMTATEILKKFSSTE